MNENQKVMDTIIINGQEYKLDSSNSHALHTQNNNINSYPSLNTYNKDSINPNIFNPYASNDPNASMNKSQESQSFLNLNYNKNYESLSNIIDHGPYNRFTFNAIFICSLMMILEGFYLSYFNNIIHAFQNYFSVSDFGVKFISSVAFLGFCLGCLLNGFLIKRFSRRKIIITSVSIMTIMHLCLSLIRNIIAFTIFRFLTTFFFAMHMIFIINILAEYLPTKFRGFVLISIWVNWNIGAIIFLLFCKIYIPNLDYDPTKPFEGQNFFNAIFPLFFILLFYVIYLIFLLYDSPRNLILNQEYAEAKKVLNYYTDNQITEEDIRQIERKLATQGENKFYKNNNHGFNEMFKKRIFWFSINMCVIYFCLSLSSYGNTACIPQILKQISTTTEGPKNQNVDDLILINILSSLGNVVAGIFVEIKQIGRKNLAIIFFALSVLCGILAFSIVGYFPLIIGISNSFNSGGFNIITAYSEEVYPTKIRDFAMSFLFSMTRLGGFTAQYVFLGLNKVSLFFPTYVYCTICAILAILIYFLPKDNTESLDSEIHYREEETAEQENNDDNKRN